MRTVAHGRLRGDTAEDATRTLPTHSAGVLASGDEVLLQAGAEGVCFLLLAGRPLHEPVVQYGPFVMNTQDGIRQAIADYQAGSFGVTDAEARRLRAGLVLDGPSRASEPKGVFMKFAWFVTSACFAAMPAAFAAEQDFSSPYDKNPQCAERTYDGNAPECLIQDEGTPRQTYPPGRRPPASNVPPQNPPTAGSPPVTPPGTTLPPGAPGTTTATPGATTATPGTTTATPGATTATPGTTTATPDATTATPGTTTATPGATTATPSATTATPGATTGATTGATGAATGAATSGGGSATPGAAKGAAGSSGASAGRGR